MKRKAQSIIEIALLTCVLAIIGFSVFIIYNNQKINLADKSGSKISGASVDLADSNLNPDDIIPYNSSVQPSSDALTALGMNDSRFELLASNITYNNLLSILNLGTLGGNNLFSYANSIITANGLNFPELNSNNINNQTVNTLISVLNYVAQNPSTPDGNSYMTEFQNLLYQVEGAATETSGTVLNVGPSATYLPGSACTPHGGTID